MKTSHTHLNIQFWAKYYLNAMILSNMVIYGNNLLYL